MSEQIRVLVVGCGNMGSSHAKAYHNLDGFTVVGVVSPGDDRHTLSELIGGVPTFEDYEAAMAETKPDAVSICTYPDTHAEYAMKAFEAGCHVCVEKPIANTVEEANE
ncbi:MAG: Gfo/Idh/MocA family oxidoreductase, partial [Verrucomicrobiota bacterium]